MKTYLLDANVVIALCVAEHEFHERVSRWRAPEVRVALCPIAEGALVRFLLRQGDTSSTASRVLQAIRGTDNCEFWPDDLSYADLALDGVLGHRQVTDAYLVGLAVQHDGLLATLDVALSNAHPDGTLLIPG